MRRLGTGCAEHALASGLRTPQAPYGEGGQASSSRSAELLLTHPQGTNSDASAPVRPDSPHRGDPLCSASPAGPERSCRRWRGRTPYGGAALRGQAWVGWHKICSTRETATIIERHGACPEIGGTGHNGVCAPPPDPPALHWLYVDRVPPGTPGSAYGASAGMQRYRGNFYRLRYWQQGHVVV